MSKFSRFMKQNKIKKGNEKYAPTTSMVDDNGKPLCWEFQHLTTQQNEELRDKCTIDKPITGKPNMFRQKLLTSQYLVKMICASTVYPDLFNAELQDSYGVKTPEELVYAMIDDPGEYSKLTVWIQKFNGFDETLDEKVDEAKNS